MWIDVEDRVPDVGREVYVKGMYTADALSYPIASRTGHTDNPWYWNSRVWCATAGVTHWWDDEISGPLYPSGV